MAIRKREGEMETQAFVHVVEQCSQDSPCVVMLMEHVLATLKKENPDINQGSRFKVQGSFIHTIYIKLT